MASSFGGGKFAVVGAGPAGCTLAAHLAAAGLDVTLCDIDRELLTPALDPGIRVEGDEELVSPVARITDSVDDLGKTAPDAIFITSKAAALPLIASSVEGFHRAGTYVVSWQNGIDTEYVLSEHLGAKWVLRAVVNYGVTLEGPCRVRMAFHTPPHWIQELDPAERGAAEALADILTGAGLPTRRAERIVDHVWRKTILNSAMSPLCAVTGKTMAQALHDPFLYEMTVSLLKEGIAVARANEISLGWDYYRYCMDYLDRAGEHKPSMLVDVEKKRRTEVDQINGKIIEYAERSGADAPYNRMIRALVKAVESSYR